MSACRFSVIFVEWLGMACKSALGLRNRLILWTISTGVDLGCNFQALL